MAEVKTVDGDHKIRDESVDVDSSVGEFDAVVCGRQERDVIPGRCVKGSFHDECTHIRSLCIVICAVPPHICSCGMIIIDAF